MVPREELPLGVELTDQMTPVLELPDTVAEKAYVEPARMLAVGGEMATETVCVAGCVGLVVTLEALPQETRARDTSRSKGVRRNGQSRVRIVCGGERGGKTGRGDRKGAGGEWKRGR